MSKHRRIQALLCAAILVAMAAASGWEQPASADVPPDYDIPGGHFFTQTNGAPQGRVDPTGYAVTNDTAAPMWDEFQKLGGVRALGYPISRRFVWNGFAVQAFQKGVLQWQPSVRQGMLVNVFDLMHDAGKDTWLQSFRSTPPPLPPEFDGGKPWPGVVAGRQAVLEDNVAIKQHYFASVDPLTFYGLPTSRVIDNDNHFVVRLQRAVIQQWKVDTPWAKAGQVTVANGGDIAKEAGLLPAEAAVLELPPWGAGRVIAIDAGHGGSEIGAAYRFADGVVIMEKELNLRVALKVADLLARAGYKPVLTRQTDSQVNVPPKLLTRRPPIGLDDDLQARIDIANKSGAKLFLSIHFNGHSDNRLYGPEVYYCQDRPFAAESKRFAGLALDNLRRGLASIGYKNGDGAVKHDSQAVGKGNHFYLLGPTNDIIVRPSEMPAALVEGLFVTNANDAGNLRVERTLDVIARAYATSVHQYFVDSKAELPISVPTANPSPTPTQQPAPTPKPTPPSAAPAPALLGKGTVVAELGNGAMLRAQPATTATALRSIGNGMTVDLLQQVNGEAVIGNDKRWFRARIDGTEGYVYASLIKTATSGQPSPPATTTPTPASLGKGVVTTDFGAGAMLRAAAQTSASVVRPVADGTTLDLLQAVTGQAVEGGDTRWYRARHDGAVGYIYGALVKTPSQSSPSPSVAPKPTNIGSGTVSTDFGAGAILRAEPKTSGDPVASVQDGAVVELLQAVTGQAVLGNDSRWYRSRYDGAVGYIYGALVKMPSQSSPSPSVAPKPTIIGSGTVSTDFGAGAMLRAEPKTSGDLVASMPDGAVVELLQAVTGQAVLGNDTSWYRARYNGTEGYVYSALVGR